MRYPFELDPQIIHHIIYSQAGSIGKAVIELIMNSVDAGAGAVIIDITRKASPAGMMAGVLRHTMMLSATLAGSAPRTRRAMPLTAVSGSGGGRLWHMPGRCGVRSDGRCPLIRVKWGITMIWKN
jgi:hypothetical protein